VREFIDEMEAGMHVTVGVGFAAGQTSDGARVFILSLTQHISCFLFTRQNWVVTALICSDLARGCARRERGTGVCMRGLLVEQNTSLRRKNCDCLNFPIQRYWNYAVRQPLSWTEVESCLVQSGSTCFSVY
jgi:hypothetical protein